MDRYGGIDVGGTSIKYGIVSNGIVESKKIIHLAKHVDRFLPKLTKAIRDLIDNKVNGIGIGFPGHIDQSSQRFLGGPNLKKDISVSEIMEKEGFENYKIDNDGNVAALAEYELFYKEKVKNFIFLSFGTGIGGGVINDSNLIRGKGAAGELGHILISTDDKFRPKCSCGLTGCFESLASAKQWSLTVQRIIEVEAQQSKFIDERTGEEVEPPDREYVVEGKKYKFGRSELYRRFHGELENFSKGSILFNKNFPLEEHHIEKRDELVSHIARGLISLYEIFDNEVFVIGGSFTDDENHLVELLNERIAKEAKFKLEWRSFPEIHIAQLKSDAGIIGASFLVQ